LFLQLVIRTNNYTSSASTEENTFLKEMKHNLNKKSKMEDNLSELGEPSSKAKYESLSDSE